MTEPPNTEAHEHAWSMPKNAGVFRCMTCGYETTHLPNTEARERAKAASERPRQLGQSYPDVPPNTEALREDIVRGLLKDRTPDEAAIAATALHDLVGRFDAIASELERVRIHDEAATQDAVFFRKRMVDAEAELERRDMQIAQGEKVITKRGQEIDRQLRRAEAAEAELERVRAERDALRNFNAATRAAYDSLGASSDPPKVGGVGPGPSGPTIQARLDRAVEALREAQSKQPERVAWFRSEGVVFDKAPGGDDYWQRIAFIIYTDLCEVESITRAALAEIEESG